MRSTFRTCRRRLRLLAIGLAAVAIAAPVAQADTWWVAGGDQGVFESGVPGGGYLPDAVVPSAGWPYSHDGPRSGPATTLPAFPIDSPRSGPVTVELPQAGPVPGHGFDWADAGIGVAVGLGFGLVVAAAGLLMLRRRDELARA
jgi:hypothetical protein